MADNPDLNNRAEDHAEWWEGVKKEQAARSEKLDAEERLENNKMLEDFGEEVDAAGDWVEADWDQFKARVQQWTNKAEVKIDDAI
ncbi:MAG: hypothetical protein Q8S35_01035 [bacterium]|nr:hypothetical protein [bacterium]